MAAGCRLVAGREPDGAGRFEIDGGASNVNRVSMTACQTLPATPGAVTDARRFAADWLRGRVDPDDTLVDDVELIVSELVTNAVQAHSTTVEITLTYEGGGVHIAVTDDGAGRPERQHPGPHDVHGRGLRIVDTVSARWGVTADEDGRKTVWSVLMRLA